MAHDAAIHDEAFADAVRRRRKNLLIRMGVGVVGVLVFSPVIGPQIALAWIATYFLVQLVDALACSPISSGKAETLPPWRKLIAGIAIAASTAVYGFFALPLWQLGGLAGGICAVLILTGGMMNALVVSGRSTFMLGLNLTPLVLYLAATPLLMMAEGAGRAAATAAAVICVTILAFTLAAYASNARLAESERQAQRDSDRRRREAESAVAGKSAFVATVSHDLRTPLSAILTGAHELEVRAQDAASRENAALIGEAGRMMKTLLDHLLDHAKLEAGRMEVETETFNLRQVLARTLRLWQREAVDQGLRLRLEGAAHAPAWVVGDATRIRQVLNNLISNALKFTQDGAVTIRIRAWDQDPDATALIIEVIDTGPGMNAQQLSRLFTPFDQTESGVSARHGGTGLGLSISRELAQLMGGWLTARSTKGEGATFTLALTLPRAPAPDAPPVEAPESRDRSAHSRPLSSARSLEPAPTPSRPEPLPVTTPQTVEPPVTAGTTAADEAPCIDDEPETAAEESAERPLRVLVVDDHEINRRAVQLILTPLGVEIATAVDGLAALTAAEVQTYDVIFMDVRMPELDGRETTRRLRAGDGPNRATPVIAVTADTAQDDIDACMAAGMDYFVSKPLTPAALLGALNHVLAEAATRETEAA
ncbi:response regulator [Brevundimonas sp. BAL450]|uniref:histidine kinase n=1 Tax=Brevundimonas abyssalis TAR-001 TaxID=1391729 RepID=A0A8E0NB63_9CAUL|nr:MULTISPECIES: ATP-binding protein [Brevundimonas]MBG7614875.1 response regulator [Brevundimonas sp. BAL450]GAD59008.1 sensor histidine kinase/response regulator [Brevundimonas abyssalis TAR-001]